MCACVCVCVRVWVGVSTTNPQPAENEILLHLYITQNFDGELSPVQFVIVRDMSDIDANSDAFKQLSTIHREDQSGQKLGLCCGQTRA